MLCLLMGLVCSVGWAQTAELQVSTNVDSPENLFTLKNGNGLYMSSYTSPTESQLAMFAFYDDADDATENAYKIYCVTSGKWVSYEQADSYSNGVNKAVLVDDQASALAWHVASATNNSKACYQISPYKTDGTVASIYMNWFQGTDSNPLDNTGKTIGFYTTAASGDNGSAWFLTAATTATEEAIAEAKSIIKVGIGYPKTTSAAYVNLNALSAGVAAAAVEAAKSAYIACTDVQLPETGKFYRIKGSVSGNYIDAVNCYSGAQMGMKSESEYSKLGTIFYLDEESRLLNVGTGTYVVNTREIGASKENANKWTFAASAPRTLGCLTLTSNYSGSKNLHDNAGNRADRCSSICGERHDFVLEEVSVENDDADIALALTKIDAKATVDANVPGTSVCQYHYVVNGESVYDAATINAAIDAATTVDEVNAIVASYAINLPETGKYYRLKGKYSGNYMDASALVGSNIGLTTNTGEGTIFYLTADNKLQSVLLGTYLVNTHSLGGTEANANVITFMASKGGYAGYLTLQTNASGIGQFVYDNSTKVDRYTVYADSRCDWLMEEVPVISLTVNAPSVVEAEATWNGTTKTLPATWKHFQGSTISNPTLSISYNAENYTYNGLTEGETLLGESVEIATLDADRTITAGFTPIFFSASTAAEDLVPVRVYNVRNNNYTLRLNAADDYTSHAVNSGTTVYGENEIWYLVGTAESFKMYSRTAGMDLALTLAGTTEASAATMTAEGTELCLTLSGNGYAISPKENTAQSFNMHGGAGNDIKLYAVTDGSSAWGVEKVAVDKPLTLAAKVNGTQPYANNTRVGHLTCTIDDVTTSSLIKNNVASQTYYLPVGATFTLGSTVYRGYILDGFLDADGNAGTYEGATIPDGGLSLTTSYSVDANNKYQYLAYSPDETYGKPYRIPAIATASNGDVIAVYDYRPCANDVGAGEVDIMVRRSTDNGVTWTEEVCIANGVGGGENVFNAGFGDAAVVADRESNKVLVMHVGGKQFFPYATATSHNAVGRILSEDNGVNWSEPTDLTSQFMNVDADVTPLFSEAYSMFFASGRLLQSRVYKAEGAQYYRIYGALLVKHPTSAIGDRNCNYVVYSDDFGETWSILGGLDNGMCCLGGDEAKVEELPDGTIILSSRKSYGRYFNVFTFSDQAAGAGSWSTEVASHSVTGGISYGANTCNGEIMKVKAVRNSDGAVCDLMLQSVPTGNAREKVTVFYKEMAYGENDINEYTPTTFAENWSTGLQVSDFGSAYSTMTLQADGNIGFFYEEEPAGYCMVYVPLSVSEMTNGAYSLYFDGEEAATLIAEAEAALAYKGVGYPTETAAARIALEDAVEAVSVNASYEGVATLRSALAAYLISTEEIQMPEDGKTYVIHNVLEGATSNTAATNNVLKLQDGKLAVGVKCEASDDADKFVCRVIEAAKNLYAFVNAKNGKYVLYYSPKSTDAATPYAADEDGKATGFAASYNNVSSSDSWLNPVNANDLFLYSQAGTRFGTMTISCKADKVTWLVDGWCTMVVDGGQIYMNTFRADGYEGHYPEITYATAASCLFAFEEVSYPNTVKLNTIDADDVCVHGLGEGKGLGTFSAPFATLLPEGVTAYYADSKAAGGVTLTELGTKAVPANQGVILVGNEGIASALMIPALTNGTEITAGATISGNQFSHTAGTTHVLALGDFVLGNRVNKGDGTYEEYGAAFYQGTVGTTLGKNKAYVVLGENSSAAKACHLNFGGETTGIESVNVSGESTGAIYDLSGRRVTQLLKGGVYIRDGKKFIVK